MQSTEGSVDSAREHGATAETGTLCDEHEVVSKDINDDKMYALQVEEISQRVQGAITEIERSIESLEPASTTPIASEGSPMASPHASKKKCLNCAKKAEVVKETKKQLVDSRVKVVLLENELKLEKKMKKEAQAQFQKELLTREGDLFIERQQNAASEEEINSLTQTISALEHEHEHNEEQQAALQAVRTERDAAKDELSTVKVERDTARGEVITLTAERDAAKRDVTTFQAERDAARGDLATVKTEQDQAKEELSTVKAERDTAKGEVITLTAERDAAKRDVTTFQAERDAARGDLATVKTERDQAKDELSTVKAQRDTAKGEVVTLTAERDAARGYLVTVRTERDAAKDELSTVKAERDTAKGKVITLKAERDAVRREVASVQAERDAANARRQEQEAAATARYNDLSTYCSEMQQRLARYRQRQQNENTVFGALRGLLRFLEGLYMVRGLLHYIRQLRG